MPSYLSRPSDDEYIALSQHVYQSAEAPMPAGWAMEQEHSGGANYRGAIYFHRDRNELVVAHRGTPKTSLTVWLQDLQGIYLNWDITQKHEAFGLVAEAVKRAKERKSALSFTGHSLGGFLAQLSVYFCHRQYNYPQVHAVVFESPGVRESLEAIQANHQGIEIDDLDIINYVSYPNIVNTCNHHIGTIYTVAMDLGKKSLSPFWYTEKTHSCALLKDYFQQSEAAATLVTDWPVGNQRKVFAKYALWVDRRYVLRDKSTDEDAFIHQHRQEFELSFSGHYGLEAGLTRRNCLPLRNFSAALQRFLTYFHDLLLHDITKDAAKMRQFVRELRERNIPPLVVQFLTQFIVFRLPSSRTIIARLTDIALQEWDIKVFRHELEAWLASGAKDSHFVELLKSAGVLTEDKRIKIIAQAIEAGAILDKGATVRVGDIEAIGLDIKTLRGDDLAGQIHRMMDNLVKKVAVISAVAVPKGAHIPKGATVKAKSVRAVGISIGYAGTSTSDVTQNPVAHKVLRQQDGTADGIKSKAVDDEQSASVISLGYWGWYMPSPGQVGLNLAEIPDDKEVTVQALMKRYAKNCTNSGVEKNETGDIFALTFSQRHHAETLVKKLCELLVIENPLAQEPRQKNRVRNSF